MKIKDLIAKFDLMFRNACTEEDNIIAYRVRTNSPISVAECEARGKRQALGMALSCIMTLANEQEIEFD